MIESAATSDPSLPQQRIGFRLQRLEVLNWETFNGIATVALDGATTMLTGDAPQGPLALMQALSELLAPREPTGVALQAGCSVILGVFRSEREARAITLAQVFWPHGSHAIEARSYICAEQALSIAEHLQISARNRDDLEAHLAPYRAHVPATARRYIAWYRRRFGLTDPHFARDFGALASTQPTGTVDDVVRDHVLDFHDLRLELNDLLESFARLEQLHRECSEGERLESALAEIVRGGAQYRASQRELELLAHCQDALPTYFARTKLEWLDKRIGCMHGIHDQLSVQIDRLQNRLADKRTQARELQRALVQHGGDRLERLSAEIRQWVGVRDARRAKAERYAELSRRVGEEPPSDETDFHVQRGRLKALRGEARERDTYLERALPAHGERLRQVEEELAELSPLVGTPRTEADDAQDTTLDALRSRLQQLEARVAAIVSLIGAEEAQRRLLAERLEVCARLEEFGHYEEMDWPRAADEIAARIDERQRLESSADVLRSLGQSSRHADEEIARSERELDTARERRAKIDQRLHDAQALRERTAMLLPRDDVKAPAADGLNAMLRALLTQALGGQPLDLETIDSAESDTRGWVERKREEDSRALQELHGAILEWMNSVHLQFARHTDGLPLDIGATTAYEALLQHLRDIALPRTRARLRRAVQIDASDDFAFLEAVFAREQRRIHAQIADLNRTLAGVSESHPLTLSAQASSDAVIAAFQSELRACGERSDPLANNESIIEARFQRMQALIAHMRESARDATARAWFEHVADVRNWFSYRTANHAHLQPTSGGLDDSSVPYLILVANLLRRMGWAADVRGIFQFIALGGRFTHSPPAAITTILDLLRRFDVQLLVLTPRNKVGLLEPYVERVAHLSHAHSDAVRIRIVQFE